MLSWSASSRSSVVRSADADAPVDTPIYNTTDYQALNYLKKRVKELESERGFAIVVELNTIMFSGTDAVEVEKPDDKQS